MSHLDIFPKNFCFPWNICSFINHFGRGTSSHRSSYGPITKLSSWKRIRLKTSYIAEMIERIINLFGHFSLPFFTRHTCLRTRDSLSVQTHINHETGAMKMFSNFQSFFLEHLRYQTRSYPFFRLIEASTLTEMYKQSPINVHDRNAQGISSICFS